MASPCSPSYPTWDSEDDEPPSNERKMDESSSESESFSESETESEGTLDNISSDGRHQIGKIIISSREIGRGRNGTIVFEGSYGDRPAAVKRLIREFCPSTINESDILKVSDPGHSNIVQYYGMERDQDFVYLALESCVCNLDDLIRALSDSSNISVKSPASYKSKLDSVRHVMQDVQLWSAEGHSTPLLMKLMKDMVKGVVYLHGLRLIHGDLKPQKVLITKNPSLHAQLSAVDIIPDDISSLRNFATRCGSSGWQAPELLLRKKLQSGAMDVFSLGLILFFCISRGKHPFGEYPGRDFNIAKNIINLSWVRITPEAHDLLSLMLNQNPKLRPKAFEVLHHPFFWSSEMRISFLCDVNNRVGPKAKVAPDLDLLKELESKAHLIFYGNWVDNIEPVFVADISRRCYDYSSLRDLFRIMRKMFVHNVKLSKEVKELLGPFPEGYDDYFTKRFPRLLMESYGVISRFCKGEEGFRKYLGGDLRATSHCD